MSLYPEEIGPGAPIVLPARSPRARGRFARGIGEPLVALLGAWFLTLVLTVPFLPLSLRIEFPLQPASGSLPLPPVELVERVRALGLAEEVGLLEEGGRRRLVLEGVTRFAATTGSVRKLLEESGYHRGWFSTHPESLELEDLARQDPQLLPKVLSIQACVFFVVGLLLARWRVEERGPRPFVRPLRTMLIGVVGGFAAIAFSALASGALELIGLPVHEQPWLEQLLADRRMLWQLAPWIVLVVPASEEVFFRGYVFRFMSRRLGLSAGLLLSSLLFAAIHLNLSGFLLYLIIGCVMAWVYERAESLAAPVIAHATLNGFVVLVGVLTPRG